jgi:hypothetical protein
MVGSGSRQTKAIINLYALLDTIIRTRVSGYAEYLFPFSKFKILVQKFGIDQGPV